MDRGKKPGEGGNRTFFSRRRYNSEVWGRGALGVVVPLGGLGGFYFALLQMTYESHSSMTNLTKRERERRRNKVAAAILFTFLSTSDGGFR